MQNLHVSSRTHGTNKACFFLRVWLLFSIKLHHRVGQKHTNTVTLLWSCWVAIYLQAIFVSVKCMTIRTDNVCLHICKHFLGCPYTAAGPAPAKNRWYGQVMFIIHEGMVDGYCYNYVVCHSLLHHVRVELAVIFLFRRWFCRMIRRIFHIQSAN